MCSSRNDKDYGTTVWNVRYIKMSWDRGKIGLCVLVGMTRIMIRQYGNVRYVKMSWDRGKIGLYVLVGMTRIMIRQ